MKLGYVLMLEEALYSNEAIQKLREVELIPVLKCINNSAELINTIKDYNKNKKNVIAVFTKLGLYIDRSVYEAGQGYLKWVVTPTTGLDHIDLEAAYEYKVSVLSLKHQDEFLKEITPTAELVFGLIFSLLRHIPASHYDVLQGKWRRDVFLGHEIKNKVMGIIGLGRLGTMVSNYAKAFGMKVNAFDQKDEPFNDAANSHVFRSLNIKSLLNNSDIVSLHIPLEKNNFGIIDFAQFQYFKRGSYLINTARGELVNENALLNALKINILRGCAVDVLNGDSQWAGYSPKYHQLIEYARQNDNLIITPHIGGYTYNAIRETRNFVVDLFINKWSKNIIFDK